MVLNDELLIFRDVSGRLAFVRHDYVGVSGEIAASHGVAIGGDTPAEFPLSEVQPYALTLHQAAAALPPLANSADIGPDAGERLWRDRRVCDVLIVRTCDGTLRAVTVGGSEPEYPLFCREAETVLVLSESARPDGGGERGRSALNLSFSRWVGWPSELNLLAVGDRVGDLSSTLS